VSNSPRITEEREVIDAPLTEEVEPEPPRRVQRLLRWVRREKEASPV
jgi:hypothetical protein